MPSSFDAMQNLYGNTYFSRKTIQAPEITGNSNYIRPIIDVITTDHNSRKTLHTLERVRPWKFGFLTTKNKNLLIATGQGCEVSEQVVTKPETFSVNHGSGAYISAILYSKNNGRWNVVNRYMNIGYTGSFCLVDGDSKKEWTSFTKTFTAGDSTVFIGDMGVNTFSGTSINYYPAIIYLNSGLLAYADIPAGGDNTGAVDNNGYSFVGNVVNIKLDKGGLDAVVAYSGMADTQGNGKPRHISKLICNYRINGSASKSTSKACILIDAAINKYR